MNILNKSRIYILFFSLIMLLSCSNTSNHFTKEVHGNPLNQNIQFPIKVKEEAAFAAYLVFFDLSKNERSFVNDYFDMSSDISKTTTSVVSIKNSNNDLVFVGHPVNLSASILGDSDVGMRLMKGREFTRLPEGEYIVNIEIKNSEDLIFPHNFKARIEFTNWHQGK